MTLPRQSVLQAARNKTLAAEQKQTELEASPEYQKRQQLKARIETLGSQLAAANTYLEEQRAGYAALPEEKAAALSNPDLTARQKYSISQRFRRKKDAYKSSFRSAYGKISKTRDDLKQATRAYNKNITLTQQRTNEARARSQQYREDNNIVLEEKTIKKVTPDGTFISPTGKTVTVKSGGTGVNNAYLRPQDQIQTASVYTPLNTPPRSYPVQNPTMTLLEEPNTSTPSGAVYSSPYAEPNTSTPQGAVFTAAPTGAGNNNNAAGGKERGFIPVVTSAGKEVWGGFTFTEGLNPDSENKGERALYRVGQGLNIIPAGLAFKGVQGLVKGYQLYKASKFYQNLNRVGTSATAVTAGAGSLYGGFKATSAASDFYTGQQLQSNLEGTGFTVDEFRGVINRASEESRTETFGQGFLYNVDARLGGGMPSTKAAAFDRSVYNQLVYEKGLSSSEASALLPVARTSFSTAQNIEKIGLIGTSAVTEIFGRGAYAAVNRYATNVFTKKVLREGTVEVTDTFVKAPLTNKVVTPFLSEKVAKGVSTTTKGGVLYAAGFGEGATQEYLQGDIRGYHVTPTMAATSGFYGGTGAFAIGTTISRGAEFDTKTVKGKNGKTVLVGNRLGKRVNLFANIVDPYEKLGDMAADVGQKGFRLSNVHVPTITVGGTPQTPTYSFGSAKTNVNSVPASYGALPKVITPVTENPAPIVTTPNPVVIPAVSKTEPFIPIDTRPRNDNKVPTDNKVPVAPVVPVPVDNILPVDNIVPTDTKTPVTVPTSVPTNIPVTIPIPVVTPTPKDLPLLAAVGGGGLSGFGFGKKGKKKLRYTPSAYALITGTKGGRPSKAAVKTGFSIRPISAAPKRKGKKKKGKKSDEELLSLLGKRKNGRKRKYKRFASF